MPKIIIRDKCITSNGQNIPWYTYPCIEYSNCIDFSKCSVIEFGAGYSSLWWAKRAERVVAVEDIEVWANEISYISPPNLDVRYVKKSSDYLTNAGEKYDVIVVDGGNRREILNSIDRIIKSNSIVIVDNSDWYPEACSELKKRNDMIEVGFNGFGPMNKYTSRTTIFFKRAVTLTHTPYNQIAGILKIEG